VLLIDDVLATGGTLAAAASLLDRLGATMVGASVVIELDALRGRERWTRESPLLSLLNY
jgi:adenine phosphoribosyltransferase